MGSTEKLKFEPRRVRIQFYNCFMEQETTEMIRPAFKGYKTVERKHLKQDYVFNTVLTRIIYELPLSCLEIFGWRRFHLITFCVPLRHLCNIFDMNSDTYDISNIPTLTENRKWSY